MALFSNIRKALGFPGEPIGEEEFDTTLPTYAARDQHDDDSNEGSVQPEHQASQPDHSPAEHRPESVTEQPTVEDQAELTEPAEPPVAEQPAATANSEPNEKPSKPERDPFLPRDLFDEVINLFNQWSPEFVRACINTGQQREYIIRSIDSKLQERIASQCPVDESADREIERRQMAKELRQLREDNAKVQSLRQKLESTRLSAERQKRAFNDRIADLLNRQKQLETQVEKLSISPSSGVASNPDNQKLLAEIERLKTLNDQLDQKSRIADNMVSGLKAKSNELRKQNERMVEELKVVDEIHSQMSQIEELIAKKDAKLTEQQTTIETLRKQIDRLTEKNKTLKTEQEQLRQTIETNLRTHADNEGKLRKEIKALRKEMVKESGKPQQPQPQPAVERLPAAGTGIVKDFIDDALDNPDGFAKASADDFGYHAPKRKRNPDEDIQPSLW